MQQRGESKQTVTLSFDINTFIAFSVLLDLDSLHWILIPIISLQLGNVSLAFASVIDRSFKCWFGPFNPCVIHQLIKHSTNILRLASFLMLIWHVCTSWSIDCQVENYKLKNPYICILMDMTYSSKLSLGPLYRWLLPPATPDPFCPQRPTPPCWSRSRCIFAIDAAVSSSFKCRSAISCKRNFWSAALSAATFAANDVRSNSSFSNSFELGGVSRPWRNQLCLSKERMKESKGMRAD